MRYPRLLALTSAALALALPGRSAAQGQDDVGAVVRSNNAFALDLYARLRKEGGNLFFSPYSLSAALAMTCAGSRGDTADEMARALRFTLEPKRLHPAFKALNRELLGGKQRAYQLAVANRLWGQKDFGFLPDFLNLTRDMYGAALREVDFRGATEQARNTINDAVEKETGGKIRELLRPGILTADTRLVLTNAIYFKAEWERPFPVAFPADFHLSGKERVKAPMMTQRTVYRYAETETFQAVELPYKKGEMAMVLLVPKKVDGLAGLEEALMADRLAAWLGELKPADVKLYLPRFQFAAAFELKPALEGLGMRKAFVPGVADFSGLAGTRQLFLRDVVHKAFVAVNEKGTEAAAATGVLSENTSLPRVVVANRPFLFLIRDTRTGSILFLGRLTDPRRP